MFTISEAANLDASCIPTLTQNGGAVATIQAFTADNLFLHQSKAFFELVMDVATAADLVQFEGED